MSSELLIILLQIFYSGVFMRKLRFLHTKLIKETVLLLMASYLHKYYCTYKQGYCEDTPLFMHTCPTCGSDLCPALANVNFISPILYRCCRNSFRSDQRAHSDKKLKGSVVITIMEANVCLKRPIVLKWLLQNKDEIGKNNLTTPIN